MKPLFKNIDCLQLHVPDLEAGIDFYCNQLGLKIIWKTKTAVGLGMAEGLAEIVIQNERNEMETDIKVDSVIEAVKEIKQAGGTILSGPFDIKIGKCAVVKDPWGNQYVILDSTKGTFITDKEGKILGHKKS
jgi:predicted enzyme related to lactoylglutathione lyase